MSEYAESHEKPKVHLESNLMMEMKGKMKDFCSYSSSKRKTRENMGLLLKGTGTLVTEDMEKAEELKASLALVFVGKTYLQESQALKFCGKVEQGRLSLDGRRSE